MARGGGVFFSPSVLKELEFSPSEGGKKKKRQQEQSKLRKYPEKNKQYIAYLHFFQENLL